MHCSCCGRAITQISKHHLIPRSRHHNKKVKHNFARTSLQQIASICEPCHNQIHAVFTEKELERNHYNLENIKSHPEIISVSLIFKTPLELLII